MNTITFFRTFGDLDAEARASGTPIPSNFKHVKLLLDEMASGKRRRLWIPNAYAMKWQHRDLNARNTQIEFLGKYDAFEKRVVRERLPD